MHGIPYYITGGKKSTKAVSRLFTAVHYLLSCWHITFQLFRTTIKSSITPRTSHLTFQPEDLTWTSTCEQHTHISPGRPHRSYVLLEISWVMATPFYQKVHLCRSIKKFFRLVIFIPCWTLTLIIFFLVQYGKAASIYLSCFKSDLKWLECYQKIQLYCY